MIWQASSEYEAADIGAQFGSEARIVIAPNIPSSVDGGGGRAQSFGGPGEALRIVFLSRICPKKNLDYVLRVLQSVSVPVEFNIYGPEEDMAYVERCRQLALSLPESVKVTWCGVVHPDQVHEILSGQDLFFFPTLGENYGHVIAEALSSGVPVLLSDTTPWRGLATAGVGWDLSLDDPRRFADAINYCANLTAAEYSAWRERVRQYARRRLDVEKIIEANRSMFLTAMDPSVG